MWANIVLPCSDKNEANDHRGKFPFPHRAYSVSRFTIVRFFISLFLDSILWYVIFTFYFLAFALYFLVFALCLIKLHCSHRSANPQIQEFFFFFMFIIMMKNSLHSNNSLSSETVSVSVFFFLPEKKYICIQTFNILEKCYLKIKEA